MCNRAITSLCLAFLFLTSCTKKAEVTAKPPAQTPAQPAGQRLTTVAAEPAPPPPSNGSWTDRQFCDAAHSLCTVEISSMVPHPLTCTVSWNGISTRGNSVHGQLGYSIPAYPGFGGAIISHQAVPNILGNFSHTTLCNQ
jgi:hypothetical protein